MYYCYLWKVFVCTTSDFSGLWIVKIWSINYVLHFESVKIDKHCSYWRLFSTDINTKIFFDCLLVFKLFWLVSKFHNFLRQLRQGVYLRVSSIAICGKFNSNFPVHIFSFFHLVCKLIKSLFWFLFVGHFLYESLISEMSRSLSINLYLRPNCYLWKVQFVLFLPIQAFFWSSNSAILVCKLCPLF